jgi:hypothetical protein
VVIAGAGYLIDALGSRLTTTYAIEVVATFTFVGEVVLMVWLLVFAARSRFPSNDQRLEAVSDATTIRNSLPRSRS